MAISRVLLAVSLLGFGLLSTEAAANPAVQACEGKKAGDPCGMMQMVKPEGGGELQRKTVPGSCQTDECCDLDYSKGSPPETVCSQCLACKEGPAHGATPSAEGDAGAPPAEPPRSSDEPPAPGPSEQRGCTVGQPGPRAGSWLLGLLALGLLRRRD